MDLVTERSGGEQSGIDQAGDQIARPWGTPGPDARWWHGDTGEAPEVPPRRPAPARHRERAAVLTAPPVAPPPPQQPAVAEPPAVAALAPEKPADEPWPAPKLRAGRLPRMVVRARKPRRVRQPRRPFPALVALLVLGLLAVFLAWVSAEPLWLSVGHGTPGTATVATCHAHGVATRCADFTADGGTFLAQRVTLLGTGPVRPGAKVPARMVSATGSAAYAGSVRLRCALGLLGILLCGFGIAWLTGAYRLPTRRARLSALALSLGGPVLLTVVVLAATW